MRGSCDAGALLFRAWTAVRAWAAKPAGRYTHWMQPTCTASLPSRAPPTRPVPSPLRPWPHLLRRRLGDRVELGPCHALLRLAALLGPERHLHARHGPCRCRRQHGDGCMWSAVQGGEWLNGMSLVRLRCARLRSCNWGPWLCVPLGSAPHTPPQLKAPPLLPPSPHLPARGCCTRAHAKSPALATPRALAHTAPAPPRPPGAPWRWQRRAACLPPRARP